MKFFAKSIHRHIAFILHLLIFSTLLAALYQQNWMNVFLIGGIFILSILPYFLSSYFQIFIPSELKLFALIFIFASLFLGEIHSYYTKFWWWDIVLHTSSGFLAGILAFILVYVLNEEPKIQLKLKPGFVCLFSFSFAVLIGTAWEIFEFTLDELLGVSTQQNSLADTMWDLIVNMVGAIVVSVLGYLYLRYGVNVFYKDYVLPFVKGNPRLFKLSKQKK